MALVKFVDTTVVRPLGFVWVNSSTPVTIASNAGYVPVIVIDQQNMPLGSTFPNPWQLRWKLIEVDIPETGEQFDDLTPLENHSMYMKIQTSPDNSTWTDYKSIGITMMQGMTGRFQYNIMTEPEVPQYIQVVAQIFPKKDGTVTHAQMIMGLENWISNA